MTFILNVIGVAHRTAMLATMLRPGNPQTLKPTTCSWCPPQRANLPVPVRHRCGAQHVKGNGTYASCHGTISLAAAHEDNKKSQDRQQAKAVYSDPPFPGRRATDAVAREHLPENEHAGLMSNDNK